MRIETTEHGRRVVVDVTDEGVRVRVLSSDGSAQGYEIPPLPVLATYPARCQSCGEHHSPSDHYCPICTGLHNPKEHAGGEDSPATADGYVATSGSVTTDLRGESRLRCAGCGSLAHEQHAADCPEYRKSKGAKR
jgi:hypothetical protein